MKSLARVAVLLLAAASAAAQATHYSQIKSPELRKFSMPQPKRIALGNGMVIFLQEDHELPLIKGSATIRGGSRDVPAAKAGMLTVYTGAWRTGGTTSKTGDELDELLEARAARVETFGDEDSTAVTLDVLKQDFDTVFPIFVDVLRNPAFREEKITLAKTQLNTSISRRNDEPGGILAREAVKLGYGPDSPYARQPEYATVASITRDDLLAFHKATVHPNNIMLAFIGDFDSAKMEQRLRQAFGNWPRGPQVQKPPVAFNPAKPGVYFIAKEDVTQASIAMVHPGIERNNPDYPAVVVMNEIFSGGFSGRLMQRLRSQRGLTYGVGGGIGANWDYPGLFRVQMSTKSGTTLESVEALRNEIGQLVREPVTKEELDLAKESILNAFVFTMDTREKALQQQVLLEFYGFPRDYFTQYQAQIGKVTGEDVQRVARKYVHPDRLAVLVVGKEQDFEKPLSTLGTVTPIDITIPELNAAPGGADAAPAATNAAGTALVNKVAEFMGGAAKVGSVTSLRRTGTMTIQSPQGAMEAQFDSVTRFGEPAERAVMTLPMGEMTRVVSSDAAFVITPMGAQDLPSSQRESALGDLRSDLLMVLQNVNNPRYTFTASGTETVGGVEAQVLDINAAGTPVRWYVEPSGRVIRTAARESVIDLSEWKSFGGLNLPTVAVVSQNGQKVLEMKLANAEPNVAIEPNAFVKP